ncbi:type II toxin-antitoxin system HipA family toxin [bacterium]|nr:type II toxin-antitoxin system HipA family toxin [bacterium]
MSRSGTVLIHQISAGMITEDENGYTFSYFSDYLERDDAKPVSLPLPLRREPYVGKTIAKYSSNPGFDVLRFFEVTLFSFLTGNSDMHLKSFSLLHAMNKMIMLTPAYDMVSTRLLISEKEDPEEMALTINGKKSNLGFSDFEIFARTLGLSPKQMENTLRRFERAVPAALDFINRGLLEPNQKEQFKSLVLNRAHLLRIGEPDART